MRRRAKLKGGEAHVGNHHKGGTLDHAGHRGPLVAKDKEAQVVIREIYSVTLALGSWSLFVGLGRIERRRR